MTCLFTFIKPTASCSVDHHYLNSLTVDAVKELSWKVIGMLARRAVWVLLVFVTGSLLGLGTLTSLLEPITQLLPSRAHLMGHLLAHAVLVVSILHIIPAAVPAEAVCAASIAIAFALEAVQAALVKGRTGDLGDVAAATVGSFAVFLFPRDGGFPVRPSWHAFTSYIIPTNEEDEDDEDSHRVNSWAV